MIHNIPLNSTLNLIQLLISLIRRRKGGGGYVTNLAPPPHTYPQSIPSIILKPTNVQCHSDQSIVGKRPDISRYLEIKPIQGSLTSNRGEEEGAGV